MSPPEIAFLALGLVLGATAGAVLFGVRSNRPARRREVRITVTPNSIVPRRATTLASADPAAGRILIPGSPGDDDWLERRLAGLTGDGRHPTAVERPDRGTRTRVPSAPMGISADSVAVPVTAGVAVAVGGPVTAGRALRDRAPRDERRASAVAAPRARSTAAGPAMGQTTVAIRIEPEAPNATADPAGARGAPTEMSSQEPAPRGSSDRAAADPSAQDAGATDAGATCAAERRLVDERCALADAARAQSRHAADALREAQRAYDALREQVEQAQTASDPREIRASKDALHRAFRSARASASSPEQAEAAAREWLTQINRLNTAAREAAHTVQTGGARLRELLPGLERMAVDADVARITAETADAACQDARVALARCEEQATINAARSAAAAAPPEPVASTLDGVWPTEPEAPLPAPAAALAISGDPAPVIRILRGDRQALEQLVATLANQGPEPARVWQMRLAGLVDAVVARAIEAGYLSLPDDGFWGLFNRREQREIVAALSALGFRFDGLGGFADGRVPAQRDLSLAVGYAGLDRMRIRSWPRESELAGLFADAAVAADEWLVDEAGDLSLGRMVDALGGRAAELADTWNAWGRVRPALIGAG